MKPPRFATARQVFEAFPPALEDIEAAPADTEPVAFVRALLDGQTPEDAVGFCAYLLPRREAVWWASQCIRALVQVSMASEQRLLELVETWVKTPEEVNRRAALAAAMDAEVKSPAAWTAFGVGWSGGSMTTDPERPVSPPNYLTAKAVRAAVLTALAGVPHAQRAQRFAECVQRAIKLTDVNASG